MLPQIYNKYDILKLLITKTIDKIIHFQDYAFLKY